MTMPDITPPSRADLVTVAIAIRGTDEYRLILGEQVSPGLVITPTIQPDGRYAGWFALTHEPSGMALASSGGCLPCIRRAAEIAARSGLDWTRHMDAIRADPLAREVAVETTAEARACAGSTCDGPGEW